MNGRDVGLLLLRLGLGVVMFAHGSQKALGWFGGPGMSGFTGFITSLGFPAIAAWPAMLVEFAGGLGVLLGVFARVWALGVAVNMAVVALFVDRPHGFFNGPQGEGLEYPLMLLCASVALACVGPGRWTVFDRER